MTSQIRLVGSTTLDETASGWEVGGSVTYSAAVYTLCGVNFSIEPHDFAAPKFRNQYDQAGNREQQVCFEPHHIAPTTWHADECVHAMPVIGEVHLRPEFLHSKPANSRLVVNAQGWLRDHVALSTSSFGSVTRKEWKIPDGVDALFFSEEDVDDVASFTRHARSRVPLVVKTDGPRGATIWSEDGGWRVVARKIDAVDPTGAGDVFASAFVARHIFLGKPIERAAQFATACAGEVVCGPGLSALHRVTLVELERLASEVHIERL